MCASWALLQRELLVVEERAVERQSKKNGVSRRTFRAHAADWCSTDAGVTSVWLAESEKKIQTNGARGMWMIIAWLSKRV